MGINWYPGHMVKARREIQNNIKLVDITIILLDARAPFSCRNRDLENLTSRKKTIMVLNKADLAPKETVRRYLDILRKEGHAAVSFDSITGKGVQKVVQSIRAVYQEISAEMVRKGRRVRPARIMVMGVPNVGKSTFLNCLVGKKMAATGARPGVTRGTQWIRVREDMEFMDTPGLMWPRIDEPEQGLKLALLDIVGENAYQEEDVALYLVQVLKEKAPDVLQEKFGIEQVNMSSEEVLAAIAVRRGYIVKGGQPDLFKTCKMLLHDFRRGNLARVGLD